MAPSISVSAWAIGPDCLVAAARLDEIITNAKVTVEPSDAAFETIGMKDWTKVD
jgi:hypothetical protein